MRFVILAAIVLGIAVAAGSSHHHAPPTGTSYPDCRTGQVGANPDALCDFNGNTMSFGQYADYNLPSK